MARLSRALQPRASDRSKEGIIGSKRRLNLFLKTILQGNNQRILRTMRMTFQTVKDSSLQQSSSSIIFAVLSTSTGRSPETLLRNRYIRGP